MYLLPTYIGRDIVVGGVFVTGCFFVSAVEVAAFFVGVSPSPFVLLLVGLIFRGPPLLQLFISPVMRSQSLAWSLPRALCGIAGVSFYSRRFGAFFFVISHLLEPRQYYETMEGVGCTS